MANQLKTFTLTGGEDLVTSPLQIADGMARVAYNYEQDYNAGYTRIKGYRPATNTLSNIPGEGPILGVYIYNDEILMFRNQLGGATSGLWRTTIAIYPSSGNPPNTLWVEVTDVVDSTGSPTTLNPDGYYEFAEQNFKATASTTTEVPIDSHDISANSGYLYGVDGKNPAFEFNGTQLKQIDSTYTPDVPQHIEVNGNRLALGFRAGEIAMSVLGDPHDFSAINGAGSIGVTDFLTGLMAGPDGSMFTFCKDKVYLVKGMAGPIADVQLVKHSKDVGSYPYTQQMLADHALFYDTWGVTELAVTDRYGDIISNALSSKIQTLLTEAQPQTSVALRSKAQYRLHFRQEIGGIPSTVSILMTLIKGENVGFTHAVYPIDIVCATVGFYNGEETHIVGTEDGRLYLMDSGFGFGTATSEFNSYVVLPFNFTDSPRVTKKFKKVIINVEYPDQHVDPLNPQDKTTLRYSASFNSGRNFAPKDSGLSSIETTGNLWGLVDWEDFYWGNGAAGFLEGYIRGHGDNVSLTISNTSADSPHTLKDISFLYEPLQIER